MLKDYLANLLHLLRFCEGAGALQIELFRYACAAKHVVTTAFTTLEAESFE
jgi:hypothetical protein